MWSQDHLNAHRALLAPLLQLCQELHDPKEHLDPKREGWLFCGYFVRGLSQKEYLCLRVSIWLLLFLKLHVCQRHVKV